MSDRSRIVAESWWQDTSLHGLILGNAVTLAGVLTLGLLVDLARRDR